MENQTSGYSLVAPNKISSSSNLIKKSQTTSTPCHDNQNVLPIHGGSIHEFFMNGSEINTSHNSTRNVPILGQNININNVSSAASTSATEVISYQRVKKVIYENVEANEALLKQKENALNHLKSIDLSKYSFPNENKPKTDYTYAKSSSYLKECKELANDNVEMPNLCRRPRRSPQNSFHQSASQSMLCETQKEERSFSESKENISAYEKLKSFFFTKSQKSIDTSLSQEHDEANVKLTKDPLINNSPVRLLSESSSSISAGTNIFTTKSQIFQTEYTTTVPAPQPVRVAPVKKSSNKCCFFFPFLLLLLIPFFLYGINKMDERENLYANFNENYLNRYLHLKINEEQISVFRQNVNQYSDMIKHFFVFYLPEVFSSVVNKTTLLTDKIIDYKDATFGGFDLTSNFFKSKNEDLSKHLEDVKEKVIDQAMTSFKNSPLPEKDLLRKEFDQIFNYTLTLVSNKFADELMQSKQSYESELNKVKEVLDEMKSKYNLLFNQMHEQKSNPEEMISFKKIEEYINRTFYLYNADKTGMTDFASESVGGSILFTRCTEDYLDNSRWYTVLNVPIARLSVSPRVVIQGSMQPGNCWAFKGYKADLFIKLAARIAPTSFSLEHIPKELSLTGVIDSAPQNFTVYGYESKDLLNDDVRLLLGNYRYDNESKNTLQFFNVQHQYDRPISVVELKIESNAGNKDFTCLYKFRVHGKIFKIDQEEPSVRSEQAENVGAKVADKSRGDNVDGVNEF